MDATETRYRVTGMDCAACAAKIETAVGRLPGVERVSVSPTAGTMTVGHASDGQLLSVMKAQLGRLGYGVFPANGDKNDAKAQTSQEHDRDHEHADGHAHAHDEAAQEGPWWRSRKGLLTIACGLALAVAYGLGRLFPEIEWWAFVAALCVGLVPISNRAVSAALAGTPFSVETLMTIAAVGAVIIGAVE